MVEARDFRSSRPYHLLVTIERNLIDGESCGAAQEERIAAWRAQRKVVVDLVSEVVHDDIPNSATAAHRQPIHRDADAAGRCRVRVRRLRKASPRVDVVHRGPGGVWCWVEQGRSESNIGGSGLKV